MRDNTEEKRAALAVQRVPKGDLRSRLPIPWLTWKTPSGETGQTRNKANFVAVWEKHIERNLGEIGCWGRDVFLTSTLLPLDGEESLYGEDHAGDEI